MPYWYTKMCFWNIIKGQIKFHFVGLLVRKIIFIMAQLWAKGTVVPFFKVKRNSLRIEWCIILIHSVIYYQPNFCSTLLTGLPPFLLPLRLSSSKQPKQPTKNINWCYLSTSNSFDVFPFDYLILLSCLQIKHKFPSYDI